MTLDYALQVVAILELGSTRLASLNERSTDPVQRAVCAYGIDRGRYLTEVKRAAWLREPVLMRGRPGLFEAVVPRSAIPEGWTLPVAGAGLPHRGARGEGTENTTENLRLA